ncbi:hypothetical protein [Deinococcus ruber]|uniref:Uncharacterized protein n=1 Tax=Deinococcus ruber TaxID=1848197 RepID=A0A918KWU1_9DEIO|nr:hypothetical protein [Deinococcus ruber]GGR37848.1 hypothetical protein GCM10008957_53920 [Deinococcus ruber]
MSSVPQHDPPAPVTPNARPDPGGALLLRLRTHLTALGHRTNLTDHEVLLFAARELSSVVVERTRRIRERTLLERRALPSSDENDPWRSGATVSIWELCREAPYTKRIGQGIITTTSRNQHGDVVRVTVANARSQGSTFQRAPGRQFAWGNTSDRRYIINNAAPDTPPPHREGKLRVYWYAAESSDPFQGARDHLIAARSIREVNIVLSRSGPNDFPHVQECTAPEVQFARDHPGVLYVGCQTRHTVPFQQMTYQAHPDAPAFRAWIEERALNGG